jgi:hypothetical protein
MLLSLALWVQATDFFTYLRGSGYVYPSILSLHMIAIAFFGGMILMTDMRLLGLAFRDRPVADLVDQFRVPKRWGFLLAITCGLLMLGCKAEEYYYNAFFRAKVVLLILVAVHALAFHRSVYLKAAEFDRDGARARSGETGGSPFAPVVDRHCDHGARDRLHRTAVRHSRMKNAWAHRYAILLAALALIVIAMGALLTSEIRTLPGAPTPSTVSAPSLEQAHRIAGYALAILTLGLAIWTRSLPGWIALAAVVVDSLSQGAPAVHAFDAQVFFALLIAVAVLTSKSWQAGPCPWRVNGNPCAFSG